MAFQNITATEMHNFLTPLGFKPMKLPKTTELVYGKVIMTRTGLKLSLRVYTAINPTGESREKGSDAIRLQLYWMYQDEARMIGRPQKCLRVPTWRENMTAALDRQGDEDHYRVCPRCGSPMVTREYKGEEFWGCATYHVTKCSGRPDPVGVGTGLSTANRDSQSMVTKLNPSTPMPVTKLSASPNKVGFQNKYRIADDQISTQQKAVEECFLNEQVNIIMGARAGSGKTTMLKHLASFRKSGETMVYLAFGKKNASEGRKKMPREVASSTTHSFCGRWLRDHYKLPEKSSENKTFLLMEDIYPQMGNKDRRRIRKAAFRLVGLAKNFAVMPGDSDALRAVMDQYEFELQTPEDPEEDPDKEYKLVVEIANEVLEKSLPKHGLIYDYNDMLWWPIVMGLQPPKFDVVLADECQDFNACQIELLRRLEIRGARIVAVGDPYQAVFRFRGADSDAYDKLNAMLGTTTRGSKELILPTNYRCCKAVVRYTIANTIVKDLEFAPDAIEGSVIEDMGYTDILDLILAEHGSRR